MWCVLAAAFGGAVPAFAQLLSDRESVMMIESVGCLDGPMWLSWEL